MSKKLVTSLVVLVLLTGCKKQVLKCSRTIYNSDDITTVEDNTVVFKNNKMYSLDIVENISLSDSYMGYRDSLKDDINNYFTYQKANSKVKYHIKDKDNGFVFECTYNFNKLDSDFKNSLKIINYKASYDDLKAEYESNGFECD